MNAFEEAYRALNAKQKQAVDTIEGPLLVIAGPGTGKTQLLSARVANILRTTDTPAQNILCLTFTESGAANMRQRLTRFIGKSAYDVNIGTYHSFGSDIISRYPEYFSETRLQNAIDDLAKRQIILSIVEAMSYKNPLKQTRHHPGDLMSTISEVKRALLTSDDLRALAIENLRFITEAGKRLQPIYQQVAKMPGTLAKARPLFEETLVALAAAVPQTPALQRYEPLSRLCVSELQTALEDAEAAGKSTPLTKWKNKWLAKDSNNHFIIDGELQNRRITALADVLDSYQTALAAEGLYDFDDMILRSINALETNLDLRYTLQERYLYVLLDEFQDTNAAQLRLVQLLTENPVNEGRPNILAVGDDDQAIYAFQGAQYSNMRDYYKMYRNTTVINLTENYRSHSDILSVASAVASQIDARLQTDFDGMSKQLLAANNSIASSTIERREFQSAIAERGWTAGRIKQLIDEGVAPSEIAILAPKHKQLEPLVPYLNALDIPVRYEKRENILDAAVVRQLVTMSRLLLAMTGNDQGAANALWPQVLSYEFWQIPVDVIWRLSWQVSDSRNNPDIGQTKLTWSQAVLDSTDPSVRRAGLVLLAAGARVGTESCETILDYLIGSTELPVHCSDAETGSVMSPLREYYTSAEVQRLQPELFYMTLSHLTVLRARLSDFQDRADSALLLADFLSFIAMFEAAEQPMIDTSPYSQQADAVQLLTVFKAKGLEYAHVFLPGCLDDVWGAGARGNSNKLTLPANLQPIRHAGATDDERLRILFVALTRARSGLYLTSPTRSFSGKTSTRLKYFDEQEQTDGHVEAMVLPAAVQRVISDDIEVPPISLLELDWRTTHLGSLQNVSLSSLLSARTDNYQFSPTHLVSFVDIEYAGPQQFFLDEILKFPRVPSPDGQFGTAIHETLEWYQHQVSEHGYRPELTDVLQQFDIRIKAKKLTEQRIALEQERGRLALTEYTQQRGHIYMPEDIAEKNFRNENVFYGDVHMAGRVDRLEIDTVSKTITVVDYKTGKSYKGWKTDLRMHRYHLQLYAYKLLIEGSRTYAGYTVTKGRLEFIESDADGTVNNLELHFKDDEAQRIKQLMNSIWAHVQRLDFPATDAYPPTLAGVLQFEQDLIDGVK
ncbi:MAG TPA: ATP-dependent DNA helicase [Candidatus Saccharimonadales bacterium]|jgi:DNA helicase-2/ATP-dependent DNA helicase PcrA